MRSYKIAILASGRGSNAKSILAYFADNPKVKIELIVSNNPKAGVLDLGIEYGIETMVVNKADLHKSCTFESKLEDLKIDLIVLAGFLWLIPERLIDLYPEKIINIHPALLPKYGGKGMYGQFVHEAVKKAGDAISGITIHYVDKYYDQGNQIFQKTCEILPGDSSVEIAAKVLKLEHRHYPEIIEKIIEGIC